MPNRYTVPEPDSDNFTDWEGDKTFDLKPQAEALTNLVFGLDESLTIGLEAGWGTGKSIFLKRWKTIEKNKGKMVIYFDAFQHDYLEDPFLALTHDILEAIKKGGNPKKTQKYISDLKSEAKKLWRPILRAAAANSSIPLAAEIFDAAIGSDEANDPFYYEGKRREAMKLFRAELENLADAQGKIVIIVDELDRCRPDFALALLEIIKHLFSVPKVYFILGLNADALADMIRVRYGITSDGRAYLGKFINVWMKHNPVSRGYNKNVLITYFEDNFKEMGLEGDIQNYAKSAIKFSIQNGLETSFREMNGLLTDLAFTQPYVLQGFYYSKGREYQNLLFAFTAILFVLRRLNYPLFAETRHRENHRPELDQKVLDWVGLESHESRPPKQDMSLSILYYLNYPRFNQLVNEPSYRGVFTGTSLEHMDTQQNDITNELRNEIFNILEVVYIEPKIDEDTKAAD